VGRNLQWFYYFAEAFVMIILHYLYVVMVALLFILGGEGICNNCINIVSNADVHTLFGGRGL